MADAEYTTAYTVGDYLLDRLAELGVTEVFGVPGDFNLEFLDHVLAHDTVRWVGGANELNAGYTADGYGRLRGISALVTTFGVGELSAANAVAGSYAEHVPVVHIVGAPSKDAQGARRVVHHSLGDGDFEHFFRIAREITCAQANLIPATATREIDRVLSEVREHKRPGYLLLATDVARFPVDPPSAPLAGYGNGTSPRALAQFTEAARRAVEEAPVLVTAGVQFTDMVSGFFSQQIDTARTIDVGAVQSTVAGQVFAPIDIDAALQALTGILTDRGITSPAVPAAVAPARDAVPPPDTVLTQKILWDKVSEALTPGNVVLADQGTSFYGMAGHRLPAGVTFIGQPLWGSIGYTLPAALGAALAHPDRRIVLLIGDGAAQLTVQEIGVMAREGIAPVIIVVNNDGYTVERAIHGPQAYYNDIVGWRWQDLPAALGVADAFTARARTVGELGAALAAAAQRRDRMAVVEVVLDRDDVPPLLAELARANAG